MMNDFQPNRQPNRYEEEEEEEYEEEAEEVVDYQPEEIQRLYLYKHAYDMQHIRHL